MKRLCLLLLCIVSMASAFVAPAMAQVQSGTVSGTVQDQQGGLLPGATITLTGSDRTLTFVTAEDGRYRFLNVPPGTYKLTAELSGFTSLVRENVLVSLARTSTCRSRCAWRRCRRPSPSTALRRSSTREATGTATNFTQDELSKVPKSRDPWALLRTVPGVQMDRVNIAGNETGQQSNFASKGASRYDTVWTMDGVVITDMSANGGSPTYFDYDAFDEIQISTSGHDIRQATGGAGLNFVVKRGTNQFRGTARGYFTNDGLEATNVPDELAARRRHAGNRRSQRTDLRLRVRSGRADRARQGVVLGLVDEAGHPPDPVRRRADRSHAAQDLQRQGELAGDVEGHDQRAVVHRRQGEVRPRDR